MAYAGTQAQTGAGTIVDIGATPVVIGEVSDLPLNRPKWATANVTNFSSGLDAEYIGTVREGATVNMKGNRVPSDAGQVAAEAAYQSGAITPFKAILPKTKAQSTSGDTIAFTAVVLSVDFSISPTKQIEFSMDLQLSGPTVITPGT
jgi:hypothetical protein